MERSGRLLVIDTATEALSVALFDADTLIGHHHEIAGRGHAEKLIPAIAALPDGGRAGEIWVDSGPGSFTGIRVGLAAARALGFAWGARMRTYSSLALLAVMAQESQHAGDIISIALTGGHGELFWQQFKTQTLEPLEPALSVPISILAQTADAPVILGTGAETLVAARGHGETHTLYPDARSAPFLRMEHTSSDASAHYGRDADAVPAPINNAQKS